MEDSEAERVGGDCEVGASRDYSDRAVHWYLMVNAIVCVGALWEDTCGPAVVGGVCTVEVGRA